MKTVVRLFFRTVRAVLGPVMIAWEWLSTPKGVVRAPEAQARLDATTRNLALYQYRTCPFCIRTRRTIARLSLNIERLDARNDPVHRATLERQGGRIQVPCLRIAEPDGRTTWLYESRAINAYLEGLAA